MSSPASPALSMASRNSSTREEPDKILQVKSHFPKLDNSTISRFLVARNFDYQKTVDMLQNYQNFRLENKIDDIKSPNGSDTPYLMSVRKMHTIPDVNYDPNANGVPDAFRKFYPATGGMGVHGIDRQGHPIYIELLGKYNVRQMAELCTPQALKEMFIINNEFMFGGILDDASRIFGTRVEKMTTIFDCTGMGLHQFHIPGIKLLQGIASINQDFYPERLHKIYIVNAPVFFSAAWAIIKLGLDKRVLEKVCVLGSDYKTALVKHISHDQLPSFLGGSCTCAHMDGGCIPSPVENIKGDPDAFRYTCILKKSKSMHLHTLKIKYTTTVNFKYHSECNLSLQVSMIESKKDILSKDKSSFSGTLSLEPGTWVFKWTGNGISAYKSFKLDYTINTEHGGPRRSEVWVDIDGDVFYDAKECLCWD